MNPGRTSQLRADLDAVAALVPYMVVSTDDHDHDPDSAGDGWLPAERLTGDAAFLLHHVRATGAGRGAPDDAVAASLFVQGYAFRLGSAALAPLVVTGRAPLVSPGHVRIRISRNRPGAIALSADAPTVDASDRDPTGTVLTVLLDHLGLLVLALRSVVRVGERMLWGNALSSFVTVLRAIEGEVTGNAEKARIRMFTDDLVDRVSAVHGPLGSCFVVEGDGDGVDTWQFRRTSCCLWYRTAECTDAAVGYCADCSLWDFDERCDRLRAELGA